MMRSKKNQSENNVSWGRTRWTWCVREALRVGLAAALTVGMLCSSGCKKKDKKKKEVGKKESKAVEVPWPTPKLVWKSPYSGTLRALEVHGEKALALSYRVKRHWAAPRRVVAFDLKNGKLLWDERKAPKMMVRTSPWSVSHALSCKTKNTRESCVLAYGRRRSWVYAFDLDTGDALWKERGDHGVALTKEGFVTSEGSSLEVLHASTGARVRQVDLTSPETGAKPNGVKIALESDTLVQVLPEGFLVTREDGGELQLLDEKTGKLKWRFREKGELGERVLRLPRVDGTLLVPAVFPEKQRGAELAAWPMDTKSHKPKWRLSLEGRVRSKWIKGNESRLLVRADEKGDREFLVRIQRDTGKQLSRVQIPDIRHCVPGPQDAYICRSGTHVLAFHSGTGKLLWKNDLGSKRKRVHSVWWAGSYVAVETASKLWVLTVRDGKKVTTYDKKLKNVNVDINAVRGPVGKILCLVVKTFQESERLDRRYLVGLSTQTGKPVYEKRLGIPTPKRRENRIRYKERKLGVPVIFLPGDKNVDSGDPTDARGARSGDSAGKSQKAKPPRIFSAVGSHVRLIRAKDGKVLREFKMPGDDKKPTALISEDGGVALVEHGDLMLAIATDTAKVIWRNYVGEQEAILHHAKEAVLRDSRDELQIVSPKGASPLPKALTDSLHSRRPVIAFLTPKLFIVRSGGKAIFFHRAKKKIVGKVEGHWYFFRERNQIVAARHLRQKGGGGTFVGLDASTGKVKWRRNPGDNPEVDPVPPPPKRERQWPVVWVRGVPTLTDVQGAKGAFLVTDSSGKCVVAMEPGSGKARWTVCFQKLTGPPVFAKGYVLLAAHGPAARRGQDVAISKEKEGAGDSGGGGDASQLFAIKAGTGEVKSVYSAPQGWEVQLGWAQPNEKGQLLFTLAPLGRTTKKEKAALLSLWAKPSK